MKFKRKIFLLLIQLLIITTVVILFSNSAKFVHRYHELYYVIQACRGFIFTLLPVSVGDVLYILAGCWLLLTIFRWIKLLCNYALNKHKVLHSLLYSLNVVVLGYLLFFLGWGVNYNSLPLRSVWQLNDHNDTLDLVQFDSLLVDRLNTLAPVYHSYSLNKINEISVDNYRRYSDANIRLYGVKPTLFGWYMDRVGIEGYFNPFTGEGQVVSSLPSFLLPFTVSHEMAHQAGIAAEGDANLMAYALCTSCNDHSFNYSGNLNLWLYVNARLFRKDSVTALRFESHLNKLTLAHIDTIEAREKLSENDARKYSNTVYDSYLKMQQQKDGIRSYGSVTANAWLLEQKRRREGKLFSILKMP